MEQRLPSDNFPVWSTFATRYGCLAGRIALLWLFLFSSHQPLQSQTINTTFSDRENGQRMVFFKADWHHGKNKTTSDVLWVNNLFQSSFYQGFDLRVGVNTSPEQHWARLLNYPEYGIGFASFHLRHDSVQEIIGKPRALYIFGLFPLLTGSFYRFGLDVASGITFNLKPYDAQLNPINDMVGSSILAYFDFGLSGRLKISRVFDLSAGASLVHFSNGRIRTPNKGVNLLGVKFGLVHYFGTRKTLRAYPNFPFGKQEYPIPSSSPGFSRRRMTYFNGSIAFGVNSTRRGEVEEKRPDFLGPSYLIASLIAEGAWKYGGIAAISLGTNFHYDGSLREDYPEHGGTLFEKSTFGITLGHELFIHKVGIISQVGYYPFLSPLKESVRGRYYLRGGVRWRFSNHWWAYIALKTMNRPVADFVEWGIGVSLFDKHEKD